MIPIIEQVLASCRDNWNNLPHRDEITVEWWLAFAGRIPDSPDELTDTELLVLSVLSLQEELNGYKLAAGVFDND